MANYPIGSAGSGNFTLETLDTAQSDRAGSSFTIDLRRSARVETRLPASLISERGRVTGLVTNLSRSGMRFEGGNALAALLLADFAQVAEGSPLVVELCFEVPGPDSVSVPVTVQARTVYIINNDGDTYQCGLEFRTFAEGRDALEHYLLERGA